MKLVRDIGEKEITITKDEGTKLKGKLKKQRYNGQFVGYADKDGSKVFRFVNLSTKNILMLSRDVTSWFDKLYRDVFNTKMW